MEKVISKDQTVIAFDKTGTGPALIYVTGAICHRLFPPVVKDIKVFSTQFTVYSYDRRGRGDSTDTQPFSLDRELDDLEAIIDRIGGSVYLYGHSSGAIIALEAALRFPGKIKKVMVLDPPYATGEGELAKNEQDIKKLSELLGERKHGAAIRFFLSSIGMPKFFIFLLPLFPGWSRMKALAPTLIYDMLITQGLPPLSRMAQMQTQACILYGGKNDYDFKSIVQKLGGAIPHSIAEEVKGQDHMVDAKIILGWMQKFFEPR